MTGDRVHLGTPITAAQATQAVLRMIRSPMVGNVDGDSHPGYTLRRLSPEGEVYPLLSAGEKRLVDIAAAIWSRREDVGARIGALGGLDPDNRRRVILVLAYLYLGRDVLLEMDAEQFGATFGETTAFAWRSSPTRRPVVPTRRGV